MSEPVKIVICLEGGMVTSVLSAGVAVSYAIVDYDRDGVDQRDLFMVPQHNAKAVEAHGHIADADRNFPAHALAMFDAVEAHQGREDDESEDIDCGQCEGTGTIAGGLTGDGPSEDCPVCDGNGTIAAKTEPADPVQIEFWIGTVTDDDGDLHSSEIVWGDGMDAADALAEFRRMVSPMPEGYYPAGATWSAHGPFLTNTAAKG